MAASNIKLTYFNVRGLAETIRFLLKYGDIEFEDERIERDKWAELKPNVPFGQVPLYEENGKVANQSIAIARYVAKKVGLVGDNDWENLEIDAIVDTITDLRLKLLVYFHEQDQERRATIKQTLFGETVPFYLERLDKIAEQNNGHLAIGKLTWADIFLTCVFSQFDESLGGEIRDKYLNVKAVMDNVLEIPSIKAWVDIRPKTDF